jgi:hypothetical protein
LRQNSILINIQNTAAPMEAQIRLLLSQNPTLNTIVISGTAVKWYDSTGSFYLTQPLEDGVTYYTQTENGCENTRKLAITVCLSVLYLQMTMSKCFVMI